MTKPQVSRPAPKKIAPEDNSSNIPNPNKGTNGTNLQYDQAQGNRGKQIQESRDK